MAEDQTSPETPDLQPAETQGSQETAPDHIKVLEELAISHDNLAESDREQDDEIAGLKAQIADLQAELANFKATDEQEPNSPSAANKELRSENERTQSGDLLDATDKRIDHLTALSDTEKGWGTDTTDIDTELNGHKDMKDYLEKRSYRDIKGNIHDAETGQFESPETANNKPEANQKSYEEMTRDELLDIWASAEDHQDKTTSLNVQDELFARLESERGLTDDHKTRLIDTLHSEMEKRRQPQSQEENVSSIDELITEQDNTDQLTDSEPAKSASDSTESNVQSIESEPEIDPKGKELERIDSTGKELEPYNHQAIEIPPINPGDYPELYARRKNLAGGDIEALEAERQRLSQEISANVDARIKDFVEQNPDASEEQIRQFSVQCYVEAQNSLQKDVIAAIDGRGYTDANGVEKGKSRLRRFGAWLDKHSSKIKKGMLVVGAVGVVALTGGIAAGAIVPAFAIGAGTAFGAAKGAAVGLGMSRHGSKESASKNIDLNGEEYQQMFVEMDTANTEQYARISDYLMQQYNAAADADHRLNVKKSRNAAVIGAVLGGIAGSISFTSPHEVGTSQTIEVPNKVPPIPHHTIQPGELTGQVIQNTINEMNAKYGAHIDVSQFVNPDGSTNLGVLHDIVSFKDWQPTQELLNGTHSIAGADNMSNEGIRHVIHAIANSHDWGSHVQTIDSISTHYDPNLPANIAWLVTNTILGAAASREAADRTTPSATPNNPPVNPTPQQPRPASGSTDVVVQNAGGSDLSPSGQSPPNSDSRPETNDVVSDVDKDINEILANPNPRNMVLSLNGTRAMVVRVNSIGGAQRVLLEYGDGTRNYISVSDLRSAMSEGRANINRRGGAATRA